MYNIDYIRLLLWLVPKELHKVKLLTYLNALIAPVKLLYFDLLSYKDRVNYQLAHNSQICYLRAALNDQFDTTQRRIYITDGNSYNKLYIFTTSENKPKYLNTIYVHLKNDYGDTGIDFIVVMPLALSEAVNSYALNALIEFYKLASKRYKVVYE